MCTTCAARPSTFADPVAHFGRADRRTRPRGVGRVVVGRRDRIADAVPDVELTSAQRDPVERAPDGGRTPSPSPSPSTHRPSPSHSTATSSPSPTPDPPSTSSTPTPGAGSRVATSDVPVGGGVLVKGGRVVVTQPTSGSFHAFNATCTHAGCLVNDVSGGTIRCPCHGSQFALSNGFVVVGPAPSPLVKVAFSVHDGFVYPA